MSVYTQVRKISGVTDHGALTGLTDDDHSQYHNDARGDARYGERISNLDVDIGTETVDSFADTLSKGADWTYVIDKGPGTHMRKGKVSASWDGVADSTPVFDVSSTSDIGDTSGVTFEVDKSGNTVRLRCTVTSDNWAVYATRTLIGS
jgi:hypothetical protein